jgi:hypothetical protein
MATTPKPGLVMTLYHHMLGIKLYTRMLVKPKLSCLIVVLYKSHALSLNQPSSSVKQTNIGNTQLVRG